MTPTTTSRLLIINPNTTAGITTLLADHAQRIAGPEVVINAVTARFGAPYIACEASYAVAGHAVLDAWAAATAAAGKPADSVLIGCFGDPGLLALRETSTAPVTGLAEAAFIAAAQHGRFAVVTGGQRWQPMLLRLAQALNFGEALAGVHTIEPTGAWLAAHPDAAGEILAQACREAALAHHVSTVIVGGAGLAGIAARIQSQVDVRLIDSVEAGVRHALAQAGQGKLQSSGRFDVAWQHVSPELTALGRATRA
jgi:allantoin racemase